MTKEPVAAARTGAAMYQIIMSFLRRYLEASHIHSYLLSPPIKEPVVFDNGLRDYLFESPEY